MNAWTGFSRDVRRRRAGFGGSDAIDDYTPGAQFPRPIAPDRWAGAPDG